MENGAWDFCGKLIESFDLGDNLKTWSSLKFSARRRFAFSKLVCCVQDLLVFMIDFRPDG